MKPERLDELQPAVDWDARQAGAIKRWLNRFESWSLAVERIVGRLVRDRNLNPLYHTGTITIFLLVLLLVSGIYLTLFYQFGFDATYSAVAGIEGNGLSRIVRAVHRYASAATMIAAVIHAWRTFFMDRFRGARWLPWVTGVAMVSLVWMAGVTGYWMIWDATTSPLNQSLIDLLGGVPGADSFIVNTLSPGFAGTGWVFLVLMITAHVGVSALIGLMLWYHLKRLNRARWLPPAHWIWITSGLLLAVSIAAPVGMLPAFDPSQRPTSVTIDLWFLAYLPAALRSPALLWTVLVIGTALGAAIPWVLRRRLPPPVLVDTGRCTGCTLCFVDCPYTAVTMERQNDGGLLAVIDPVLCVSCGICIGSCPPLAISYDGNPPESRWPPPQDEFREGAIVSFLCERHTQQGSADFEGVVVPVTCVGMIHPDEVQAALEAGASRVRLVGCPPDDCASREGNEWAQARLTGGRRPKATEALDLGRVDFCWIAPGDALPQVGAEPERFREVVRTSQWRRLVPVAALIGIFLIGQVLLTYVRVDAFGDDSAFIEVSMKHRVGSSIQGAPPAEGAFGGSGIRLEVLIDGSVALDRSYGGEAVTAFEQIQVSPTRHNVLVVVEDAGVRQMIAYEESLEFGERQVLAIAIADAAGGPNADRGEDLFTSAAIRGGAGCRVCHSLKPGEDGVGPSLAGVGIRAVDRVAGLSAEEYLRRSILEPDEYVVEGFRSGQMRADVGEGLTETELADLIAFLLTLR
ncbi:MAG: hydrogenase iron-sulfur subunit [Acidimicrobiia bacterium]|nr:hydrogenase iron-sulfur subunit [Acidimicrobiia bacterium]